MNRDIFVFFAMVACGGCISLLFDFFRAFRIVLKPHAAVQAVSDVLFCAISTFLVMACVWNLNGGLYRAYEAVGLILGGIFYFLLLGKWILKFFVAVTQNILKFVRFILKILLTPSRFLYKILIVPIRGSIKNMIRRSRDAYAKRIQRQNH